MTFSKKGFIAVLLLAIIFTALSSVSVVFNTGNTSGGESLGASISNMSITVATLAEAFGGDGDGDGDGGCCGDGSGTGEGDGDGDGWNPPPPPPAVPACSISAAPTSIELGDSATLVWSSSYATSASINQGIGAVAVNGSRVVSPQTSTTYTLSVVGPGSEVPIQCATTVTVITPPPPPVAPTCTLTATPSRVAYNGSTILEWSSTNATSASLNQGIGSVALSGVRAAYNLTSNRSYVLTVEGPGGSATCSAQVTVDEQPQAPTCDLYADRSIIERGEPVALNWSSQNAFDAYLTDFGSVALSGSRTVYPNYSRTYTLTVTGEGGTRTCSEYVAVRTVPPPPPPPPPQPRYPSCTITVNPSSVAQGKTAVLSWNSYNAVSATISQLGGYIPLNGSRIVYGNTTTQYYMTVRNAFGQTATCATTLGVYTPPVVPPPPPPPVVYPRPVPQPIVRYVPVSSVPYTGTEDTAYILGLIGVFVASVGGAAWLYTRVRPSFAKAGRRS